MAAGCSSSAAVLVLRYCGRQCVLLLLPTMVEGGGCAVMVDAGVMVGVVAAMMAEGERRLWAKKRERRIVIIYVISK